MGNTEKRSGPTYRTCQGCYSKPSHGVAVFDDGGFFYVCDRCVPTDAVFTPYEPTVRAIVDEEMELDVRSERNA